MKKQKIKNLALLKKHISSLNAPIVGGILLESNGCNEKSESLCGPPSAYELCAL